MSEPEIPNEQEAVEPTPVVADPVVVEDEAPDEDEALDAIMSGSDPEPLEDTPPAEEPDGPPEPVEVAVTEEPEPAPADDADSPPPVTEEAAADVDPDEYARALTILQRDNAPPELVSNMDPAAVIDWADKRSEVHKHWDTVYGEHGQMKDQLAKTPDAPASEAEPVVAEDWIADTLKPLADDELFADVVAPITEVASTLQTMQESVTEQVAMRDQTISFLVDRIEGLEIDNAKNGLREQFPQLDDPAKFKTVREQMTALSRARDDAGNPVYGTMQDLMQAASVQALHGDIVRQHQANQSRRVRAKDLGQPDTQTALNDQAPTPPTQEQIEDAALDDILDGRKRGRAGMPA